jgi:hypothetical protein
MKLLRVLILGSLALAVAPGLREAARADSTISINAVGASLFTLGADMGDEVTTLDITVGYDEGSMSNPSVSCAPAVSKAKCDVSTATSGVVSVSISSVQPLSGSIFLARLKFTLLGDQPGTINSLDARLTDSSGNTLPVQVNVVNPTSEQAGRSVAPRSRDSRAGPTQPAATLAGGVKQQEIIAAVPVKGAGRIEGQPQANGPGYRRLESVLDRFRGCQDSATLGSLLPLFEGVGEREIRQDPSIALSDGASTVRLTLQIAGNITTQPIFALHGSRLISLVREGDKNWTVEVLPDRGVYAASLMVLSGDALTEYPLSVSPPLEPARRDLGEADFAQWRQSRSLAKSTPDIGVSLPRYVEDYIYVANYLATKRAVESSNISR